jgi:outer membrane protein insertion porin family
LGVRILWFVALIVLAFGRPADAQAQGVDLIRDVAVNGTQRVERETVRSYLLLQEGDPFDTRRIDQSLKSLFATGLFADVSITRSGTTLVVNVVENPVINRIAFEGNKRVGDSTLAAEVTLRPRVVFTRSKVQNDVKRILDVYRVNGRFAATVEPKIIQLEQNRADLVFEIDEGPLTKVENIRFVGNKVMSDKDLRQVIKTKEAAFYRFLSNDDIYDPDRVTFDRELLRRFYLKEGYADVRVESAVAELTADRTKFFLTFTLDEGPRYKFGDVDVAVGLRGLDREQLLPKVEFKKGDWYNSDLVETVSTKIGDEVGNRGYAFVDVKPRVNRNKDTQTVDLTYEVAEGPRVFVERIDIVGNVRTIDKVIRREVSLVEGDAFNAAKIRRSRQRIRDLDFFSKVDVTNTPGSAPDKSIVKVEVEEKSTGSLSLGVGYANDQGPLVDVGLRERNLMGRGQTLAANTTLAGERTQVNVSFTEPYFLDRELAAGVDLFHTRSDLRSTRSYDLRETGAGTRLGYQLSEYWRQNLRYGFKYREIDNVRAGASALVKQQKGERYISEVGQVLAYDRRDSKLSPTEGYLVRLSNDLAGLGGSVHYLRSALNGNQYFSLTPQYVLSLNGRAGYIFGLGEDVNISDRFFLGGDSLRGFKSAGAGPRDLSTGDSLGGEWIYNGSVELKVPVGLPDELGISGRLFSDFGSAGGVNPSTATVNDNGAIRVSAGAGIGWASPFGPVAIDLGVPLVKEAFDKREIIRVNFGTRF